MTAAQRYDMSRAEQDRDRRRVESNQERWPGVSNARGLAAWFCEDCVKTGCHTSNPTLADLDAIAADYRKHRAEVHGEES